METEELDNVKIDGIYIHSNGDVFYKVLYVGKMKIPFSGNWVEAVVYQNINNKRVYVRELNSFVTNFTLAM